MQSNSTNARSEGVHSEWERRSDYRSRATRLPDAPAWLRQQVASAHGLTDGDRGRR